MMDTVGVGHASGPIRVIRTAMSSRGAFPSATSQGSECAAAVVVLASDGDPHPALWADAHAPVLVVLPPHTAPAAVLASFAAGADACICTASSAEVTAHLGAMLRRSAARTRTSA